MPPLSRELRQSLERTVIAARRAAEGAASAALSTLAVSEDKPHGQMSESGRVLRRALRAKMRQLGGVDALVSEIAYQQWHRMLFARFLAENHLLIYPGSTIAVSLDEVAELTKERGESDLWVLAARFAAEMLPAVFRTEDPTLEVRFAPEGRQALEALVTSLPGDVFATDDALGWVYQFWQSEKRKEVNRAGAKIGGTELPAVTQLFTEHYMVRFLLENSVGAWWVARHPQSPLAQCFTFLRFTDEGLPAAGSFEAWPETSADLTVMDPCCGSGHFLTAAFEMLTSMRMEEQGLSAAAAGDAVIRENLFGVELDPRCTQIAAFALALAAWKRGGYRELPAPNIASCGIPVAGQLADWRKLAAGDERLAQALEALHEQFRNAPELGSLIDPRRATDQGHLFSVDYEEVAPLLERLLEREGDPETKVAGWAAAGIARAAALLAQRYWLVVTNPPFLGRGKQADALRAFLGRHFEEGRQDLATAFLQRALSLCSEEGLTALVSPENWLIQVSYEQLRTRFLAEQALQLVAVLGEEGFEAFGIRGPRTVLLIIENHPATGDARTAVLDVSTPAGRTQVLIPEKLRGLRHGDLSYVSQAVHAASPGNRILFGSRTRGPTLGAYARSYQGLKTGDDPRYRQCFWEAHERTANWRLAQGAPASSDSSGLHYAVAWGDDGKLLARAQGMGAWTRSGVAVTLTRSITAREYEGCPFFSEIAALIPNQPDQFPAILHFATSGDLGRLVREVDRSTILSNATLLDVPFDLEYWQTAAAETRQRPQPHRASSHPTDWSFGGDPTEGGYGLHVATARLLGYRWPLQSPDFLDDSADADGAVCLPPVAGEAPAAERLRRLLERAWADRSSPPAVQELLEQAGARSRDLHSWLRDEFFLSHTKLFHNRPFIWHIWDGRTDGFAALVNYHRLDQQLLNRITYTLLGAWIEHQRDEAERGFPGAENRVSAAEELQRKLKLIAQGEPPHDIYVRWKQLGEQPLGWNPDLNDGVRVNIRPFVTAGALRSQFSINWNKDRGTNPDGSDRRNSLPPTRVERERDRQAWFKEPS